MSTALATDLADKILSGGRLACEEALELFRNAELLELGELAQQVRFRHNPEPDVSFVIDSNPNYTNICTTDCVFCAFYRKPGQ